MKKEMLIAVTVVIAGWVACAEEIGIGINRTNLQWEPEARQWEILDEIHELGVPSIRLAFVQPHEPCYQHIQKCNELGMDVVLFVPLMEKDLYFEPNVPMREGNGDAYGIYTFPYLSEINVEKFAAIYSYYIQQLKMRKLKVKAVQVGNELNWCAFNGDMPMADGGIIVTEENWRDHDFMERWGCGMQKYGEVMKRVREETDRVFADAPHLKPQIVTYGVAKVWPRYVKQNNGTIISPSLTARVLAGDHPLSGKMDNVFDSADAAACHIYPDSPLKNPVQGAAVYAAQMIEPLTEAAGNDKPLYITEWGVAGAWFKGFPDDDTGRLKWMGQFIEALESERFQHVNFEEIIFFDYDHMPPFSVWQDGKQLDACRFFKDARFKR